METNNKLLNTLIDTDSYKFSHWRQYPSNTTYMFSYLESRGGEHECTVFFGLQYYLKRYLEGCFVTPGDVEDAARFAKAHGVPFNYDGWMRVATVFEGRLPIRICAVPEGAPVPTGNILMSVESTDPETFWIVSWLETMLVRLWYPITVATRSWETKNLIRSYLDKTADDPDAEIGFKLHDFGSRGVSSQESAMIGGAAHLVNFMGSDTVAGIWAANQYYGHDMAAFSIPAAEHSTMTMWGKERETDAYANMLEQYKDQPIFACVSDSYDIFNAARNIWGGSLKDKVEAYNGTLVVRPDSGNPIEVVSELLKTLEEAFGSTVNSKGYKVLNHDVRVIQGDGVNPYSIGRILERITEEGFSTTNVAFGMGGGLLQQLNRDTCKFAFKCSAARVDGELVDVYKDPVTDSGKKSKRGALDLVLEPEDAVRTIRRGYAGDSHYGSLLDEVFLDGKILREQTLDDVREVSGHPLNRAK